MTAITDHLVGRHAEVNVAAGSHQPLWVLGRSPEMDSKERMVEETN